MRGGRSTCRMAGAPGSTWNWSIAPARRRAEYVERLRRGYADFGFDPAPLEAALAGG